MPISHHSHSGEFCKHATGSLTDSVAAAIARKFHTYGLSEHVPRYRLQDLYPEEIQASMSLHHLASQFDGFVAKAHVLKSAYADQIVLLVGLETEYITDLDLDRLDSLLHRLGDKIQYIVGSVHHVNAIPIDFDIQTHQKAIDSFANGGGADEDQARGAFLESYFDAQYELMQRFQPEIIGHVDLCRLYTPELRFADYPRALEKLRRNIKFAVDYGALFEVNAAAFRKNWKTAYPGRDVLELICQEGGRLTLSDDSHGPQAVGLNYALAKEYLESAGIKELWYLEESTVPNAGGRKTRPVRLAGEWQLHRFWTHDLIPYPES